MKGSKLVKYWEGLPEEIRDLLIVGSIGKDHLLYTLSVCVNLAQNCEPTLKEKLSSLALEIQMALLEQYYYDRDVCNLVLNSESLTRILTPDVVDILKLIKKYSFFSSANTDLEWIVNNLIKQNINFKYFLQLRENLKKNGLDYSSICKLIEIKLPSPYHQFKERLLLDYFFEQNLAEELFPFFNYELKFSETDHYERFAKISYIKGDFDQAIYNWKNVLKSRPWNSNLILRLYDLLKGIGDEKCDLKGSIAICFYTYNKSESLNKALDSLFNSKMGEDFKVYVLLNGCTDNSREVVRSHQERMGYSKLDVIDLPINIGAPAGRNWLLSIPGVRASDWVIFLDDDIILPEDWLLKLGAAVRYYPDAAVWGCMIVRPDGHGPPQGVDWHFYINEKDGKGKNLSINNSHFDFHWSNFSYLRPAGHVTGCTHLFKTSHLQKIGGFDLRFSPSQFDDVDHDLRAWKENLKVIYNGHLRIEHFNLGVNKANSNGAIDISSSNFFKLANKYDRQELGVIKNNYMNALNEDFFKKVEFICRELDL